MKFNLHLTHIILKKFQIFSYVSGFYIIGYKYLFYEVMKLS